MITIMTDHEIIHKIEAQATAIDTKTIPSHPIGIISVTPILNIDTEVTHQSIKDPLVNYGKIQLFLVPTRTMEQNKILNKPFKPTFHITDIKHNIIGIPFIYLNIYPQ